VQLIPYVSISNPAHDIKQLKLIVQQAFSQRRKTLRNALKPFFSSQQLEQLGIDPDFRPQQLSVSDYVKMSNCLSGVQ
jgi:16S rRNA (adenine1518-N6/adenine1519-N6)-dimethyltransferase